MKYRVIFVEKSGVIKWQVKDQNFRDAIDVAVISLVRGKEDEVVNIEDEESRRVVYCLWRGNGSVHIK